MSRFNVSPGDPCPNCKTRMARYSIPRRHQQKPGIKVGGHDACPNCQLIILHKSDQDQDQDQDQAPGILMRLRFSDIPLVLLIAGQIWMASTGIEIDPTYRFYGALITIIYAGAWVVWRMSDR